MIPVSQRWRTRQPFSAFQLVVGFAVGMLVAALVLPSHKEQRVLSRGGTNGSDSAAAGVAGAAAGATNATTAGGGVGSTGGGAASSGGAVGGGGRGGAGGGAGSLVDTGDAAGGAISGATTGITAKSIRLDVLYPDLSALKALGPDYDNGNVPQQWQALIDGYRRSGRLPVNGRDIELVFHSYNVLSQSDQRSACVAATQDDKAFAVIGVAFYLTGAECVAREHKTPLITFDGPDVPSFQRSAPYMFSIDQAMDRLLNNYMYWAESRHALDGKRIGLYYANDPVTAGLMNRTVKAQLARMGHKVVAEATTGNTNGGPEDAVTVQRFRSANVDLALLFTSKTGFMQAAQAQGYKPKYIESGFLYGTSDVTTSTYPPEQFDGTYAITTLTGGMVAAGMAPSARSNACIQNYERFAGLKTMDPSSAAYGYVLISCDEGEALMEGLKNAGDALNVNSFVHALEGLSSLPMVRGLGVGSFTARKHDAVDQWRTLQWHRGCTCWVAQGDPQPLWIS